SIAVKYLTSTAFGSALVDSFIWAVAKSGVAATRQAATSKSARMQSPRRLGSNWLLERDDFFFEASSRSNFLFEHDLFRKTANHFSGSCFSSKVMCHPAKRRPPGGGLFANVAGTAGSLLFAHDLSGKPLPTPHQVRGRLFSDHALEAHAAHSTHAAT